MAAFRFVFFRLNLYLVAGILCGWYFHIPASLFFVVFGILSLCYAISYLRSYKIIFDDSLNGIATFLLIFSIGFGITVLQKPDNQPRHYLNNVHSDSSILKAYIAEELKENQYSRQFILEAMEIRSAKAQTAVNGKILLQLNKDSLQRDFSAGSVIWLPAHFEELPKPLNPFQFDYSAYLKKQKISSQLRLKEDQILITEEKIWNLKIKAKNFRKYLINNLKDHQFSPEEIAVFQALILGERREISNDLYESYARAGALHILAISGLHIGILMLILSILLKPVQRLPRGKLVKAGLIVLLLWCFAFLTGLNPSVLRATCMFSFITFGMQLNRKGSTLNSVFLSMFFLLLIDPYLIFQVGFQLSYLAVTGIVIIQPLFDSLWKPSNKFVNYLWKTVTVSLCAQFAILPLSLFYFHQFPGGFLLSNMVVLPALGIILAFGIIIIILAAIQFLPEFMVQVYNDLLQYLNEFISFIASLDALVISNISLSLTQLLSFYFLLISAILLFIVRKARFVITLLSSILLFQLSSILIKAENNKNQLIVFNRSRESIFGIKSGEVLQLSSNRTGLQFISDYKRERGIRSIDSIPNENIAKIGTHYFLKVDSNSIYDIPEFKAAIILLSDSPNINFERLLHIHDPEIVVADGSNFKSLKEKWKQTAKQYGVQFHDTSVQGAYVFNY